MKCKLNPRMCVPEDTGIRHRKLPKLRKMLFLASNRHLIVRVRELTRWDFEVESV